MTKFIGLEIKFSIYYYQFVLICPYSLSRSQHVTKFIGLQIKFIIYNYHFVLICRYIPSRS